MEAAIARLEWLRLRGCLKLESKIFDQKQFVHADVLALFFGLLLRHTEAAFEVVRWCGGCFCTTRVVTVMGLSEARIKMFDQNELFTLMSSRFFEFLLQYTEAASA